MGIFRCFNSFGFSPFAKNVCMSDYVYYLHLTASPRYLFKYSTCYQNPKIYFGLGKTEAYMEIISKNICDQYSPYYLRRGLLTFRVRGLRISPKGLPKYIQVFKAYPF